MAEEKFPPCSSIDGQLSRIPDLESSPASLENKSIVNLVKAFLAKPWNHSVKPWLKMLYRKRQKSLQQKAGKNDQASSIKTAQLVEDMYQEFTAGELVRVRTREEIDSMLDPFHETKGCAFLDSMYEYCGTVQKIYVKVERFLDERSFKVRSARGLYFLENLQCTGTEVFGRCDRRCYYFWRADWLDKIDTSVSVGKSD